MGIQQMMFAVSVSGSLLPGGTSTGSAGVADAYVTFNSDGSIVIYGGTEGTSWYLPNTTGIGSSYWIKFTVTSGSVSSSTGSWVALSVPRTVYIDSGSPGSATVLVEIASDSGGSTVVASGTYTLTF